MIKEKRRLHVCAKLFTQGALQLGRSKGVDARCHQWRIWLDLCPQDLQDTRIDRFLY